VTEHTSLDQGFLDVAHAVRAAAETPQPDQHTTGRQDIAPDTVYRSDRSANLRIRKQFTDRNRDSFQDEGFQYIARYFENSLNELKARNSEIDISYKRIDANHFESVVYISGKEQSRCGIWQNNGSSVMEGIMFSYHGIGNGNGFNESMLVDSNGYTLFFRPMGMAHIPRDGGNELTHEGAAEYYWSMFIDRLR
jgi:hypothetical protein